MGKRILLIILTFSVVANFVAFFLLYKGSDEVKSASDFELAQQKYPLLSKRILQEYPQDLLINFLSLRDNLRKQTDPYAESFGLYFEYLPTGTSININGNVEFYAASLFKVPVLMAYYHGRERMQLKDDPLIEIKPEFIDKKFGNLWKKGPGTKISVSEAVKLTIVDSDNTAARSIVPYVMQKDFDAVYKALDVDLKADKEGALISAKSYSSILKALYFSAVINKDDSEKLLDLMTRTKFPDKLAAGVPNSVTVAHKIGDFIDNDGKEGFRDCGIVYVPRRHYLLCMFSVSDEQTARERMQTASKTVYDYVSSFK